MAMTGWLCDWHAASGEFVSQVLVMDVIMDSPDIEPYVTAFVCVMRTTMAIRAAHLSGGVIELVIGRAWRAAGGKIRYAH